MTTGFLTPVDGAQSGMHVGYLSEPELCFGGGGRHIDPKSGLTLFGAYSSAVETYEPTQVRIGLVGTPELVTLARAWFEQCRAQVDSDGSMPFFRPAFPGLNREAPFAGELVLRTSWDEVIPDRQLAVAADRPTEQRVRSVAEAYLRAIQAIRERDSHPDIILLAVPDAIASACEGTPTIRRRSRKSRSGAMLVGKSKQGSLFDDDDPPLDEDEVPSADLDAPMSDLRRAIKASAMAHGIPTQIVRERSLRGKVSTDAATRAWNFCVALLYKCGAAPWRLAALEPDTCFVGVSFFRDKTAPNPAVRASLAQLFTQGGDGFVLRGEAFEWNDPRRSPHLDRDQGRRLIEQVLDLYERQTKTTPRRVAVFKSSQFWDDERRGMLDALAKIPRRDFVAVTYSSLRLMRQGRYPPLRGTYLSVEDDLHLLYTQGYVPFLRTYPGSGTPNPIEVRIADGDTPADQLLAEILGLTKVNWNTAAFACHLPMTLNFARRVGEILGEMAPDINPATEYRFFM